MSELDNNPPEFERSQKISFISRMRERFGPDDHQLPLAGDEIDNLRLEIQTISPEENIRVQNLSKEVMQDFSIRFGQNMDAFTKEKLKIFSNRVIVVSQDVLKEFNTFLYPNSEKSSDGVSGSHSRSLELTLISEDLLSFNKYFKRLPDIAKKEVARHTRSEQGKIAFTDASLKAVLSHELAHYLSSDSLPEYEENAAYYYSDKWLEDYFGKSLPGAIYDMGIARLAEKAHNLYFGKDKSIKSKIEVFGALEKVSKVFSGYTLGSIPKDNQS